MLYSLEWLRSGKAFPPKCETDRITRYIQNKQLFAGDHFDPETGIDLYEQAIRRILNTCEWGDVPICYPILLNYQKLISLKKADLVCGEEPEITGNTDAVSEALTELRQVLMFDSKLYASVIDLSRYGDVVWRMYIDENTGMADFAVWEPMSWYPIVTQDGTFRITHHVLAWKYNVGTVDNPKWRLSVQIHPIEGGYYLKREYNMTDYGRIIGTQIGEEQRVETGFSECAVIHVASLKTSGTVFGYDDYVPVDSILCEIMTRLSQISSILDKHANPSITGPVSMLSTDPKTGEKFLKKDQFFATSPGENEPKYLTWDGKLDNAFDEIDLLLKQLYVITEMGGTILGVAEDTSQAISGTALRSKMAAPLITVRRLTNVLTYPVKRLLHAMTVAGSGREEIPVKDISIEWNDGLPTDPREDAELAKLLTGRENLMPVAEAIVEYLHKTPAEAQRWREQILKDSEDFNPQVTEGNSDSTVTGGQPKANGRNPEGDPEGNTKQPDVNPNKKGSTQGLSNFHGVNNK